jgi:peroxiredoxin family protein/TusA-related sulfurtransferase
MSCPGPLLKLKDAVASLPSNGTLHITATDAGFKSDVKAFALSNQLIVSNLRTDKGVIHVDLTHQNTDTAPSSASSAKTSIRKGATIVIFSQDYDKAVGAFVLANGAAAMGGEVTIFCTFWGLNVLRHPSRKAKEPKTFLDSMFAHMMPKGIHALPLSNMNFAGMGALLLKHVMREKNLPNLAGLLASAKQQSNIRIVACSMSMEAMGITADELIDGVEIGGVADYMGAAQQAGTNLFI